VRKCGSVDGRNRGLSGAGEIDGRREARYAAERLKPPQRRRKAPQTARGFTGSRRPARRDEVGSARWSSTSPSSSVLGEVGEVYEPGGGVPVARRLPERVNPPLGRRKAPSRVGRPRRDEVSRTRWSNLTQGLNPTSPASEMQARERFSRDRTRNLHAETPVSRSLHGLFDTCADTSTPDAAALSLPFGSRGSAGGFSLRLPLADTRAVGQKSARFLWQEKPKDSWFKKIERQARGGQAPRSPAVNESRSPQHPLPLLQRFPSHPLRGAGQPPLTNATEGWCGGLGTYAPRVTPIRRSLGA
jgi:hypothetical protein